MTSGVKRAYVKGSSLGRSALAGAENELFACQRLDRYPIPLEKDCDNAAASLDISELCEDGTGNAVEDGSECLLSCFGMSAAEATSSGEECGHSCKLV